MAPRRPSPLPELRYLSAFAELAADVHFGRTARRLGITQPSLSQQIARLEDMLGAQLVDRSTRPLALTNAGRDLADAVAGPLARIAGAVGRLRVSEGDRTLRIALPRTQLRRHRPVRDFIDRMAGELPGWQIEIVERLGRQSIDALADGSVDVAVAYSPVYGDGLRVSPLFMDQPVTLMRADHPLADLREVELAAFRSTPLVTWASASVPGLMDAVFAACDRLGFRPSLVEVDPRPGELLRELRDGTGVGIIARAWAENAVMDGTFVTRPLSKPSFTISGVVVWRAGGRAAVRAALAACVDEPGGA